MSRKKNVTLQNFEFCSSIQPPREDINLKVAGIKSRAGSKIQKSREENFAIFQQNLRNILFPRLFLPATFSAFKVLQRIY